MSYPRYVASQSKRELVKSPEERKKKRYRRATT